MSTATKPAAEQARRAVTLFEVPFATAMSDLDLALLTRTLDLSTRMDPVTHARHDTLGLAHLDQHSGLFLKRGAVEGEWSLKARTWGHPSVSTVHEWQVLAAGAARQLDPEVPFLERLHVDSPEIPDRPVGWASNKRFARTRRRFAGVL
jgi:hypothetical protein